MKPKKRNKKDTFTVGYWIGALTGVLITFLVLLINGMICI
jgi:hypothetical protein